MATVATVATVTLDAMKQAVAQERYITGTVEIDLADIIDSDLETFLDLLSEALTDSPLLMDVSYHVVGHTTTSYRDVGSVVLEVTGDPSEIVACAEDDSDEEDTEEESYP